MALDCTRAGFLGNTSANPTPPRTCELVARKERGWWSRRKAKLAVSKSKRVGEYVRGMEVDGRRVGFSAMSALSEGREKRGVCMGARLWSSLQKGERGGGGAQMAPHSLGSQLVPFRTGRRGRRGRWAISRTNVFPPPLLLPPS